MCKIHLIRLGLHALLWSLPLLTVSTIAHAQTNLSREEVAATGQWLDARKAIVTGKPVFLHLRTGHERALLMPEPVRLSGIDGQTTGFKADIDGDVVRFYPLIHFDQEPFHLTGLETGTEYELRIRASAFGIRQPLQLFLDN